MTFNYQAFGLNISSQFAIPMLTPAGDGSDLLIKIGKVDSLPGKILFENKDYQIGNRQFLFRVPELAEFLVSDGRCITVNPFSTDRFADIYVYVLGSCLGAALYQRGNVCLHGSAVKIGEKAILITGDSGSGKSTLSSVFCGLGYPFLTDDVALIREIKGKIFVYPSYPHKKLWQDAIENLHLHNHDLKRYRILNDEEKYSIKFSEYFWGSPLELSHIYELIISAGDVLEIRQKSGIEKMEVLTRNTYRSFLIKFNGLSKYYFDLCTSIIGQADIFEILRPCGNMTQEQIAAKILHKR